MQSRRHSHHAIKAWVVAFPTQVTYISRGHDNPKSKHQILQLIAVDTVSMWAGGVTAG